MADTTPHAPLRRSPLDERHRSLGATMTPFGGWEMPLDYGSVVGEHRTVRESCGVFDLSHLGTLTVTGPEAEACVQAAFSNDAAALAVGRAHYTLCLTGDGGILDDLIVYRLTEGFLAVPNAANTGAVLDALREAAEGRDAEVSDIKDSVAVLAVQGPSSPTVVTAAGVDVKGLGYLDCRELPAAPARDARIADGVLSRSGYTGERGYELFVPASEAGNLWDRLVEAGAQPTGLGSRDTLRLEMGYPLHGQDISVETSPVVARLGWAVKPSTEFRGRDAYVAAKEAGAARRLWGLRVLGRGVPRADCVVSRDGEPVGRTTSGTFSPTLRTGIALGYLDRAVEAGETVEIEVRAKTLRGEVMRPPFVDADPKD